jgi:dUTP pyrophosphatase
MEIATTADNSQFQACGIDLTFDKAYIYKSCGVLDFDNSCRKIADAEAYEYANYEDKQYYPTDGIYLPKGSYKVSFNEHIKIPNNLVGFCYPRSSLLRCGATLDGAVWDAGYEGIGEALLIVHNQCGILLKKKAKIAQIVFARLTRCTDTPYEGIYKQLKKIDKNNPRMNDDVELL